MILVHRSMRKGIQHKSKWQKNYLVHSDCWLKGGQMQFKESHLARIGGGGGVGRIVFMHGFGNQLTFAFCSMCVKGEVFKLKFLGSQSAVIRNKKKCGVRLLTE